MQLASLDKGNAGPLISPMCGGNLLEMWNLPVSAEECSTKTQFCICHDGVTLSQFKGTWGFNILWRMSSFLYSYNIVPYWENRMSDSLWFAKNSMFYNVFGPQCLHLEPIGYLARWVLWSARNKWLWLLCWFLLGLIWPPCPLSALDKIGPLFLHYFAPELLPVSGESHPTSLGVSLTTHITCSLNPT